MVESYWTARDDCRVQDWAHKDIWANLPFHLVEEGIDRFLECKERSPFHTTATMVVPVRRNATWWPTVEQHFRILDYLPPFSQVFTASPLGGGGGP